MWSTCVFYFISPQYLKAFSCSPFPSVTSVTLQWLTQDWYAVVICALQWCSVKISSIQIHGNEKFSTGGERKRQRIFLCVCGFFTPLIQVLFLLFHQHLPIQEHYHTQVRQLINCGLKHISSNVGSDLEKAQLHWQASVSWMLLSAALQLSWFPEQISQPTCQVCSVTIMAENKRAQVHSCKQMVSLYHCQTSEFLVRLH